MMEQSTEIVKQMSELHNRGETLKNEKKEIERQRDEIERQRDEAVNKLDQLQELMRSLESIATDTVHENKAQKEKIAERDSHIMILSETCRDLQEQLAELQFSQIESQLLDNNARKKNAGAEAKEQGSNGRFLCLPIF
jgi:chromosome segregation ATPase